VYLVGFDPGGRKAFGWAVVAYATSTPELVASGTCSGARMAFEAVRSACGCESPSGIGTDAPLYWVLDGDRRADSEVRRCLMEAVGAKASAGTVGAINSLRGACLVEGVQVTRLACRHWPQARVTEAHPKALMRVDEGARDFASRFFGQGSSDHERDAAVAAYAAHKMLLGEPGWIDLVKHDSEPFFPGGMSLEYWFPAGSPGSIEPRAL
jgi:hypothetical protein